jgi:hypothetical protein
VLLRAFLLTLALVLAAAGPGEAQQAGRPNAVLRAATDEQYAIQVLTRANRFDEAEPRARAAVAQL